MDGGVRILRLEADEKTAQGVLLLRRSRILGMLAVGCASPDVADADGGAVVPRAMGTDGVLGTPFVNAPVAVDDVVVTDGLEAPLLVPSGDVCHGEVLAFGGGRAVDDEVLGRSACLHG